MEKIVILNSGGFDSFILSHLLREDKPDSEIHSLFFNYGQNNSLEESNCSKKISDELGFIHHTISLPSFHWSHSDFYTDNPKGNDCVEYRNLIFISYAASFAESIGAKSIYAAILKSGGYLDTSKEFLDKVNSLLSLSEIKLLTPLDELTKYDLIPYAFDFKLTEDDFFSCNHPVNGKPCGKCPDCIALKEILNEVSLNDPMRIMRYYGLFNLKDKSLNDYKESVLKYPVSEIRLLINNDCQLNCKHCYYGFKDMVSPRLSLEEYRDVIKQCKDCGITSFHFSGKEPLYDDFIFDVAGVIREEYPEATYHVVTNGITIPKYAQRLKDEGFSKVFLSIDDITALGNGVRNTQSVSSKALYSLNKVGLDIEVFIDMHPNNFSHILELLSHLHDNYGVTQFYIRTIVPIGNALSNDLQLLQNSELDEAYTQALHFAEDNPDCNISFTVSATYTYNLLGDLALYTLKDDILGVIQYNQDYILDNFRLYPEIHCTKYTSQVTLTPDGYLHGCASECSSPCYDKIAAGNIREKSLSELIRLGKELNVESNLSMIKHGSFPVCPHMLDPH